jgi:hypothetical protein
MRPSKIQELLIRQMEVINERFKECYHRNVTIDCQVCKGKGYIVDEEKHSLNHEQITNNKLYYIGVVCNNMVEFDVWISENKDRIKGYFVIIPLIYNELNNDPIGSSTLHAVAMLNNPPELNKSQIESLYCYHKQRTVCYKCDTLKIQKYYMGDYFTICPNCN